MDERDPDAWWSPIPGTGRPAVGPEPEPNPGPYAEVVARARPRRRRRVWAWLAGGATVLTVAAVVVAGVLHPGTKTLVDPGGTVSVAVPRSWYDNDGQRDSDPGVTPLVAASNLWQSRYVVVDRWETDTDQTLRDFHDEGIAQECSQQTCSSRSGPRPMTVSGHEALEQVVTHPAGQGGGASTLVVLSVWADDHAVELYAEATASGGTAPDAAPLETIAGSLRLL